MTRTPARPRRAGQRAVDIALVLSTQPDLTALAGFDGVPFESHTMTTLGQKLAFEDRIVEVVEQRDIELVRQLVEGGAEDRGLDQDRLRREHGVRSFLAHNMTVTPANLGQVAAVIRDCRAMGYGMFSFQPAAFVGDERRWREDYRRLGADDVLADLGSGDGRVVIAAARRGADVFTDDNVTHVRKLSSSRRRVHVLNAHMNTSPLARGAADGRRSQCDGWRAATSDGSRPMTSPPTTGGWTDA